MAESTLGIAYSELIAEIGYVCGYGRTEGSWSSTQASNVAQALKRGLRMFYNHPPVPGQTSRHEWRFLRPVTTIYVWPTYTATTGVIVDTSTNTITADTGTTFYASMVGKTIVVNSVSYTISAVNTSAQTLTVSPDPASQSDKTWAMTSDGTYQLPDGFGGIIGKMTFSGETTGYGPLPIVGEFDIRNRQQRDDTTGRPMRVAIRSQTTQTTSTVGTRWELVVDPVPDSVYTLKYQYRILPDNITSSYAYHLGGAAHAQTILEACLAAAEMVTADQPGPHYNEFIRLLIGSIEHDNMTVAQDSFGYNGNGAGEWGRKSDGLYVTYNGVQY